MWCLVVLVTLIFLMDYVSAWFVMIIPEYEYWLLSPLGIVQVGFQTFVFGMAILSYYRVVSTPPGKIPMYWKPEGFTEEELEEAKTIATSKEKSRTSNAKFNTPRYCTRCERFKPPRSHHCSECNVCVPRMDHHCPWINNCVGNGNHKLFVVFLFWGIVGISYTLFAYAVKILMMFYAIWDFQDVKADVYFLFPIQGVIITINYVVLCPLVLGMISLYFWHQNLALQNSTTIEYHIKLWAKRKAKKAKRKYVWPYDFGPAENLKIFYGPKAFLWCYPSVPSNLSDGIHFPIACEPEDDYDDEEIAQEGEEEIFIDQNQEEIFSV